MPPSAPPPAAPPAPPIATGYLRTLRAEIARCANDAADAAGTIDGSVAYIVERRARLPKDLQEALDDLVRASTKNMERLRDLQALLFGPL